MTPFHDIADYLAVPRIQELRLSPDGGRLVCSVAMLDESGAKYVTSLWELDPDGRSEPRRLTFAPKGETSPRWLADGSLVFLSARPTGGNDDDEPVGAVWLLPAAGGEAQRVLHRPGGVSAIATARVVSALVAAAPTLAAAQSVDDDERLRKERKDRKVAAILHERSPVRYWDHDLGPGEVRLYAATVDAAEPDATDAVELTPQPHRALDEQVFDVSPDGSTVVTGWAVDEEPGLPRAQLLVIDVATGHTRPLAAEPGHSYADPVFSPDGTQVACRRLRDSGYDEPLQNSVWVVDVATGAGRVVAADADLWPMGPPTWAPDGSALFVTADHLGHHPIFRIDLADDTVTQVTASGHYSSVNVSPDGGLLYALRDHIDAPPSAVRVDAHAENAQSHPIPSPGAVDVPGRLEHVSVVVDDGTTVHGWLTLPDGASADEPAPMLLWIHGGPLSSWNSWSWRWNPWLMTAKGYAVLLPDPALSTGYGSAMIERGWGQWGGSPYADLMAITDEVIKRPDIDETRIAAMGGSYGGYMANWVAGHTDRFRCIVTHASLWALDQFQGTTDHPAYWAREWGLPDVQPGRYDEWSPHRHVQNIASPMLVIHGDRDYRVPIGEALRLWWDLQRHRVESKFLYFADEGHWILSPGNAQVWYETVWAWLAQHVLGEPWQRPELL